MARSRKVRAVVETIDRRRVLEGFIKVDEITYAFDAISRDGQRILHTRRVMERGDSAAALVFEKDTDTLLLTEQVRAGAVDKGPGILLELIAGSVETGEDPAGCIVREIREEVGYRIAKSALRKIGTFYLSPGGSTERVVLFYVEVTSRQWVDRSAAGAVAEGEDIRLVKMSRDAFALALAAGTIADAKTALAGYWMLTRSARVPVSARPKTR